MIETVKKVIKIPEFITVKDFSDRVNLPVTAVISELIKNGVMASINETIDFETAQIVGEFLGLTIEIEEKPEHQVAAQYEMKGAKKDLKPRPPVVTIMGHVIMARRPCSTKSVKPQSQPASLAESHNTFQPIR